MEVRNIINSRRKELGLTMKQVADAVGVSEGTVSRWESGEIENIRKDKLPLLSRVLNIPIPKLMGFGDYPFGVGKAILDICIEKKMSIDELAEKSRIDGEK